MSSESHPAAIAGSSKVDHRGAALVRSALNAIDWIARGIVVAALIGEISVVLTDITIRSLFTLSLLWSDEASKLCLVTLAFIGGAVSYRARHHTAIQFVTRFLPNGLRAAIAVAVDALILFVALTTLIVSFDLLAVAATSLMPMLQINAAWAVVPFTIGMALIALFALERLVFVHPRAAVLVAVPIVAMLVAIVAAVGNWQLVALDNGAALGVMLILFF
ncbi:MAG TPA: TRAP transporter small permease subunit, partial [Xanthobacteraceae bacterium]